MITAFFRRLYLRKQHGRNPLLNSVDALLREQEYQKNKRERQELERKVRVCLRCDGCLGFLREDV